MAKYEVEGRTGERWGCVLGCRLGPPFNLFQGNHASWRGDHISPRWLNLRVGGERGRPTKVRKPIERSRECMSLKLIKSIVRSTEPRQKGCSVPCYRRMPCRLGMNPCIPTGTKVLWPIESTLGRGVDKWGIYTGPSFEAAAPTLFNFGLPERWRIYPGVTKVREPITSGFASDITLADISNSPM